MTERQVDQWSIGIRVAVALLVFGVVQSFSLGVAFMTLRAYLAPVQSIPTLAQRIGAIEARIPPLQVLEFQGGGFSVPMVVNPGQRVSFTFLVRRTHDCEVTVFQRWYDMAAHSIDSAFSSRRAAVGSSLVSRPQPFTVTITIPDLPPGEWAYAPLYEPGPACPSREVIAGPMARFTVQASQ